MKHHAIFFLFLLVPALGGAAAADHSMPVGYHEFALFGADHLYISHFPMFSSLHAYQVIAKVRLSTPDHDARARFLDAKAAHAGALFIVSPYRKVAPGPDRTKDQDDWVLPETVQAGRHFNADLHYAENHADHALDTNVDVEIVQVIRSQLLDPTFARPSALAYVLFGTPEDAYLAHVISAPPNPGAKVPDFDQILSVNTDGPVRTAGSVVTFTRGNLDANRLKAGELAADTSGAKITVKRELFDHSIMTER